MFADSHRFFSKTEYDPVTECIVWVAARDPAGYGAFKAADGRKVNSHRWIWEKIMGPIERGLELDHLCRNRACVNLEHLEPVTRTENVRRGFAARRALGRD